jgi:hypothetical protein
VNPFRHSQKVEAAAVAALLPWIQWISAGRYELYIDASPEYQREHGDLWYNANRTGKRHTVELKAEEADKHGNLFLETWSNKADTHPRLGWLYTSRADWLWYYFIAEDSLYVIKMLELRRWAFWGGLHGHGRVYQYREGIQSKREQRNCTTGACVPIEVIESEVGCITESPVKQMAWAA